MLFVGKCHLHLLKTRDLFLHVGPAALQGSRIREKRREARADAGGRGNWGAGPEKHRDA